MSQTHATVIPMRRPTSPDEPTHHIPKGQPKWLADDKWHAESPEEANALAHLRGWTHFGPACPLCMRGRS
jgi:hypothetical protein